MSLASVVEHKSRKIGIDLLRLLRISYIYFETHGVNVVVIVVVAVAVAKR